MITKRNGNGQTECKGCKEKGKFALTWDSFLYNFNDKPYCFDCLLEKLEELQQRIDKVKIEISALMSRYLYEEDFYIEDTDLDKLLQTLDKGSDSNE